MCGGSKEKKCDFSKSNRLLFEYDTAIKDGHSTPMKFRNQHLPDLFLETLS